MIVSLMGTKSIIQANSNATNSSFASSRNSRNEDILIFGCSAINSLLSKLTQKQSNAHLEDSLLNRIMLMMLQMESKKARQSFTEGLYSVL